MKYYLTLFLFLVMLGTVFAQAEESAVQEESETYESETGDDKSFEEVFPAAVDPASLKTTEDYSAKDITVKKFDNKKLQDVIGNANYDENTPKRKADKKNSGAGDAKANTGGKRQRGGNDDDDQEAESDNTANIPLFAGPWMQLLFYAIVIVLIGIIVYNIIKNTTLSTTLLKTTVDDDAATHVEDIADLDVDSLLKKAQAAGNYRLVLRLYFLGLLKKLNETGVIIWKKDKTNRDYLTELFSKQLYFEEVRRLTLAYEQVWYGDHTLSTESYHQLMNDFKAVDEKINASKTL